MAATKWAWEQAAELSHIELLVLLAYADYADDEGRAWPRNKTVATKVNLDARSVRRVVAKLEEKARLHRLVNAFAGGCEQIPEGRRPNVVQLHLGGHTSPPTEDSRVRGGGTSPSGVGGPSGPPELSLELPKELTTPSVHQRPAAPDEARRDDEKAVDEPTAGIDIARQISQAHGHVNAPRNWKGLVAACESAL
ncbi:MAG: helix-turn-helix domain-containing protein, partial [Deltaproteobacteria bacterium]|nr:helix-turn-helix domain-containing protein [Deltaproteobacteria bacterium]